MTVELPRYSEDESGDFLWVEGHHDDATNDAVFADFTKESGAHDLGYVMGPVARLWHLPTVPDDELLHEVEPLTPGAERWTRIELSW